jgi:hydroxymethylglutaryl-CoA lyase
VIRFTECWARDGIQAEQPVTTADKLAVIEAAAGMGASRVEVAAFSKPSVWPQSADAEDVVRAVRPHAGVEFSAYVPNLRALGRLVDACGSDRTVGLVLVAVASSDSYNRKNVGRSLEDAVREVEEVVSAAVSDGFTVIGCVGTAWACPIEGRIGEQRVLELSERLLRAGAAELVLGDTTGEADIRSAGQRVRAVKHAFGVPLSGHFHNARGTAMVNAFSAIEGGVDRIEGSLGGVGGHPPDGDQPAASPNLCTEDFVSTLVAAGYETEVVPELALAAGRLAERALGRRLLSQVQVNGLPARGREASA